MVRAIEISMKEAVRVEKYNELAWAGSAFFRAERAGCLKNIVFQLPVWYLVTIKCGNCVHFTHSVHFAPLVNYHLLCLLKQKAINCSMKLHVFGGYNV